MWSELELPEASCAVHDPPDWTLHLASGSPPIYELRALGESLTETGPVRLFQHAGGYRLTYPDTGSYDISADGTQIAWYSVPGAPLDLVRADILGPVLALALHVAGVLCLHGSAVALGRSGVAFLGPKGHGKSTLAMALTTAGAALITDDTLAVDLRPRIMARPGVHSIRLWWDSAERLGRNGPPDTPPDGTKVGVTNLPEHLRMAEPMPLQAIYLLEPVHTRGDAAVHRTRLRGVTAALSLIAHSKLGLLLGEQAAAPLLQGAVALAKAVPVHQLAVVHDFDRLPEVIEQLLDWHHRAPAGTTVSCR
ncbi:MAG: hypothetical protein H0X65_04365 [Gemmatimonadetes bacterium]|nr:hypothetical protein [Gemmatimonadota bacterium]